MKKVLFITNIPSPYRVDFFNELGKTVDLTVIYEARRAKGISFDWNEQFSNFNAIFLSDGEIQENKFNFAVLKYIKKEKYDCIFVTNYAYKTELLAYLKLVLKRIPFVLEIDGAILKRESLLLYKFKRFLLTKPYAYFSPSKVADDFLKHYGAKSEAINRYNFTSLKKLNILEKPIEWHDKAIIKEKFKVGNKIVILCVAQIINRKGIDVLLESLNKISGNYKCYIIGEKPDQQYYESISQQINSKIEIVSFKKKSELEQYYKMADIFVLPTRFDVWGLVINEAMAHGLPVITTQHCGAGLELIRDGVEGYLVSTESSDDLKDKISELIDDEEKRNQMGVNGLKRIQEYSIEKMVETHVAFLD